MTKQEILEELENIRSRMYVAVANEDQNVVTTLRKRMTELFLLAEENDKDEIQKILREIADIGPRPPRSQGYPPPR